MSVNTGTATGVEKCVKAILPVISKALTVCAFLLNSLPCGRRDDRVGMLSESSRIATGPLKRKLLFQLCSARKSTKILHALFCHLSVSFSV